jgi:transposase InsO family protein
VGSYTEDFITLLQRERIKRKTYADREEARRAVFDYVEMFYDPKRRHSANDGLSPVEFEKHISRGSELPRDPGAIHHSPAAAVRKEKYEAWF